MFGKLFKSTIPSGETREVEVLQSWTLKWEIQGNGFERRHVNHKAFIDKKIAEEFANQLRASAEFLGTWIKISITEN